MRLNEFALPYRDYDESAETKILRLLASQWWYGDADPKAETALASLGWTIELAAADSDDDGVVVLTRPENADGDNYISFNLADLELDDSADSQDDLTTELPDDQGVAEGSSTNAEVTKRAKAAAQKAGKTFDTDVEYRLWYAITTQANAATRKADKKQGVAEGICSLAEAEEIFNDFERAVAARGLTEDIYDTVTDEDIIRETAAWRRKAGKSAKGGLNAKGVASYRRENPGSKLQMAVTTKPSKLKKGSKAAKRRKSFCARMSGVKGPMKKPNGKPTRKALALRKWNC